MKVILQQDVPGTGVKGQLVEVSAGYARNYLIPRKLAAIADEKVLQELTQKESAKAYHKQKEMEQAQQLASRISGMTVRVKAKGGSAGRLFGAVTSKDVAQAAEEQLGEPVDRKKLVMDDIKSFGTYEVEARVYSGITATFYVLVTEDEG